MTKSIDLSNLPDMIDKEVAEAYIEYRKVTLKKPLTQYGFNSAMKRAMRGLEHGVDPNVVIDECMDSGWQGINVNWVVNKLSKQPQTLPTLEASLEFKPGRLTKDEMLELDKHNLIQKRLTMIRQGLVEQPLQEFIEHCRFLGIEI